MKKTRNLNLVNFFSYILLILIINKGFSQNSTEFHQLRGENVPTQSITYAVAQDSIGNVWVASEEGILKHNSSYYKLYNTYNGIPESLGNRVNQVFIDSKERIWIGLENGVCLYDADEDVFKLVESESDLTPTLVSSIAEDSKGNIFIADLTLNIARYIP